MIVVHHLENSRSQRIVWLLEELGLEYRIEHYKRDPETMLAPAALRRLHPLGKSPLLEDEGEVFAESAAIIEHLVEAHGSKAALMPSPGSPEHKRYRFFLHYAEGSLMPPLLVSLVMTRVRQAPVPFFVRPVARGIADKVMAGFVQPQLGLHLDFLEAELATRTWFAGEAFTAADIQMGFPLIAAATRGGLGGRTNLERFLARIRERPAFIRAEAEGGAFSPPG